ncbi:DJ-1/PfpI family protein [Roseateles amylovorans]|uniref:DJ-1/PfpI family protein n=1 Tax=Roseateles amylovorans TaxID=2978473 RepID=A0ABY6AYJ8_9BURK|nr:DJ-1/PfpI family protein [Roseateles amylovorans]UXH78256.1 DJ-1/PfpI family protein [Roseateles amylovorans]
MAHARRQFLRKLAAASVAGSAVATQAAASKPSAPEVMHDMSTMPPQWHGKEQIAMLLYPDFTALDLVGPYHMFTSLWGATVHLVAATNEPVRGQNGITFVPTMTLDEAPADLDILFVPGGDVGTLKVMRDPALIAWVADRGRRAKMVASVCTGSMILGQAGLLRGKRATSHWGTRALLKDFGAIPVDRRVVWDGKVVTGAGVSAGLDLGLAVVARLRDKTYAQGVQLMAEYAPQPPLNAGTPKTAPPAVHQMMDAMFDTLRADMRASATSALGG